MSNVLGDFSFDSFPRTLSTFLLLNRARGEISFLVSRNNWVPSDAPCIVSLAIPFSRNCVRVSHSTSSMAATDLSLSLALPHSLPPPRRTEEGMKG